MPEGPPLPEGPHDDALLFRTFAAAMPHIVWMSAADAEPSDFNPVWHTFTGLPTRLPGATAWTAALHPDEVAAAMAAWKDARATGSPFERDLPLRRADGAYRWHHVRSVPVKLPDGSVRWLGSATDIHERKTQQDGFNESLQTLELLNETGQSLAAELQLEKLVQGATDAATRLCKASFGAFFYNVLNERGQAYMLYTLSGVPREAFDKFPMPRATRVFEPTLKGERIIRSDDITKDPRYGHNAPYHGMPPGHLPVRSYLAVPVKSRSGEVMGALFFGHPEPGVFTEREEKLVAGLAAQVSVAMDNARLFQRAQEAITSRDTFLSIASHELRTPITSMKMQTQHMRKRIANKDPAAFLPERVTRLVEQTERSIGRLSRLVEDMLDISRIATGRLNMRFEQVELSELAREVVERLGPQLTEAGHMLELHLTPGLVGRWDRERLEQVLANLLSNALKYAPGAPLKVTTLEVGTSAILEVEDRGPGIAPEDHHRVFERFERLVSTNQVSGLGLGLHISRHIVEAHGGTIRVRSAIGEGARFIVELPLSGPPE